jgi:glycosyltransferase involved in cell wall biosynthesis
MKKICIVVSTPMTVKAFLLKHIKELKKSYDICIVSSEGFDFKETLDVDFKIINIQRKVNIIQDIKSVYKLYRFLKSEKFDMVLSVTPKAGLVASLASSLTNIKVRTHFFTGQVWATKKGFFRFVLKSLDRLVAKLNTINLTDSFTQKDFLVQERITSDKKLKVLHKGSISGVDIEKFKSSNLVKKELQEQYDISKEDISFMFIGRLNADKGIFDLVRAFDKLLKEYENVKLFLIGPDEENIENQICEFLKSKKVIRVDYVSNPQEILNIADILVLPSYREGFGTIVIEAASMAIPCVASDIYGLKDAVVDGQTGLLHKVKDIDDMVEKYEYLIKNKDKIREFGANAQDRVYADFKDTILSQELKKTIDMWLQ